MRKILNIDVDNQSRVVGARRRGPSVINSDRDRAEASGQEIRRRSGRILKQEEKSAAITTTTVIVMVMIAVIAIMMIVR